MASKILTLKDRKAQAVAAKDAVLSRISSDLSSYARQHGGRFILFGSGARGELRHDSDLDFLVDFPEDREKDAIDLVEDLCGSAGQSCDVFSIKTRGAEFLSRVMQEARILA